VVGETPKLTASGLVSAFASDPSARHWLLSDALTISGLPLPFHWPLCSMPSYW
jgi:hypothetical protein